MAGWGKQRCVSYNPVSVTQWTCSFFGGIGIKLPQWKQCSGARSKFFLFCMNFSQLWLAMVPGYILCQNLRSSSCPADNGL